MHRLTGETTRPMDVRKRTQSNHAKKSVRLGQAHHSHNPCIAQATFNMQATFTNTPLFKGLQTTPHIYRSTFFNFATQILNKRFMMLAGIQDHIDHMDKQF